MEASERIIMDTQAASVYKGVKLPPKTFNAAFSMVDYFPVITEEDIDTGSIVRYFVRQVNHSSGDIIEVDERTFRRLRTNPLYKSLSFNWKITGPLEDVVRPIIGSNEPIRLNTGVITANKLSVEEADSELPGLKYKLLNYKQFWVDIEDR